MGGNKGGAPQAPDFQKLSMVNQANPLGGASWFTDPATGQIRTQSSFSGQAGQAFNGLLGGMATASQMDPSQASQQAFDKVYGSYASRLDPRWAALRQGFDTKMANSGAVPGETAYTNANREFNVGQNDAYNSAIAQAVGLGQSQEAQTRATMAQPFNLAGGMMSMLPQNNPNMPLQGGILGYNAAKDQASANNSKKGSSLAGLGNIGGALFGGPLGAAAGKAGGGMLGGTWA